MLVEDDVDVRDRKVVVKFWSDVERMGDCGEEMRWRWTERVLRRGRRRDIVSEGGRRRYGGEERRGDGGFVAVVEVGKPLWGMVVEIGILGSRLGCKNFSSVRLWTDCFRVIKVMVWRSGSSFSLVVGLKVRFLGSWRG